MKIIIVQRHPRILDWIKDQIVKVNPGRAAEITFTTNPIEVMCKTAAAQEPVLIVSGQVLSMKYRGTHLAEDIKKEKPQTIFLLFSALPEPGKFVDGIINKFSTGPDDGPRLLVKILTSDLEGETAESLRLKFRAIRNGSET